MSQQQAKRTFFLQKAQSRGEKESKKQKKNRKKHMMRNNKNARKKKSKMVRVGYFVLFLPPVVIHMY